jgi:tetratricopeptide (TPR) repeat protein
MLFRQFKALPADKVEEKVAGIQQLEGVYTQSSSMGSPEWAVASLWKLGLAYAHLADTVDSTPVPKGLSAAENEQFRAAVKQQVQPIRDRSEDAFKACLSRAAQLEVFSAAVLGCHKKEDRVANPVPPPLTPVPAAPSFGEVQRKADTIMDAASIEALGLAYMEQRQVHLAHLTLARATELEDGRATAHNALGLAELYEGDPMGARAEYQKAIDSDPTLEKARANLAALRCRYGDVEGAKRELGLIKETAGLGGADVDPEWKACR